MDEKIETLILQQQDQILRLLEEEREERRRLFDFLDGYLPMLKAYKSDTELSRAVAKRREDFIADVMKRI